MDEIYYVDGIIQDAKELKTKTDKDFLACKILDINGDIVEASCFDAELLDKLKDFKAYSFKIEKKGNYKNIVGLSDVNPEIENKIIDNANKAPKPQITHTKPQNTNTELYITLNGKTYVTQKGLLNEAHKKGLKSITTELIEFKDQELAVVKATLTGKDGSVFTGYGDATKDNVNSMIVKHILRMAETRAINRSMRLFTNIGVTSIEELEN